MPVPSDAVEELFRHGDQALRRIDDHIASQQAQQLCASSPASDLVHPPVAPPKESAVPLALIVHEHTHVDARCLGRYLQLAAQTQRGVLVYDGQGQQTWLSYQSLYERSSFAAQALVAARRKVPSRHQRAVLHFSDLEQHLIAFWGCVLSRTVPVTVAVPPVHTPEHATVKKLLNVWELLQHPAVITDHAVALRELGLDPLQLPDLERQGSDLSQQHLALPEWPSPDETAFFQLTSGSTGTPKCVQISHRGVAAHAFGSAEVLGITHSDISMNWLPLDHVVPLLTCHCADVIRTCTQIVCVPGANIQID